MNFTVYSQDSLFEELESDWNELLRRSYANSIFSTWEWQTTWWSAYHPGMLWVITCRNDDGRLLGIAPWFIEDNPERGRVVRSIGCVDVTDYLDVIVDQDNITSVLDCFANFLVQNQDAFDILDLCNIPEHSPTYSQFPAILSQHNFATEVKQQEVCPVIALPDDWNEYLAMLNKKQRHEVRRKLRRADGAAEKVDWYIVDSSHDLNEEAERFIELMAASDAEKAEFLTDEQNTAFFKSMVPLMFEKGWLQLNFLTVNGEAAATYLNFDYNGRILVYNSGLMPEAYGHLSPGIVLLSYNIRHAIENQREAFDFLRGNETYKHRMGGVDTAIYMLIAKFDKQE